MDASILLPSAGCLGILLVLGAVLTLARHKGVAASKAGSSYSLREMAGELTPAEKRAEKRADIETYNANARSGAFHQGATEYQSYDGTWRNL